MNHTKTAAGQAGKTIHKLATEFRNAKVINPQEFKELTNNRFTRADQMIAVRLLDDPRIQNPQRANELLGALRDQDRGQRHDKTHGHGSAPLEAAASGAGHWARRMVQGVIPGVRALVPGVIDVVRALVP